MIFLRRRWKCARFLFMLTRLAVFSSTRILGFKPSSMGKMKSSALTFSSSSRPTIVLRRISKIIRSADQDDLLCGGEDLARVGNGQHMYPADDLEQIQLQEIESIHGKWDTTRVVLLPCVHSQVVEIKSSDDM